MATRDGLRTVAAFKKDHFMIIVNGWKPLTIITKSSILGVAAILDAPQMTVEMLIKKFHKNFTLVSLHISTIGD